MILRSPLQSSIGTRSSAVPWQMQATGAGLRDALANPSAWGETLGPELVSNGDFSNGTTGWTAGGSPTVTVGANGATVQNGGAVQGYLSQPFTTISGRVYRVVGTIVYGGVGFARLEHNISSTNPGGSAINASASGTYNYTFTAGASTTYVIAGNRNDNNASHTYDNISVREVVTGWLLPGLGGARLSGDCRTSVAMQTLADGTVGFAAHNLLAYSESIVGGTGPWIVNGATVTANNVVGPTGTLTASRVVADGTGINQGIYATQSAAPIGTVATFTVWLRGAVGGEVVLIGDASARQSVTLTTSWQRYENPGHALLITPQVVYALNNTAMTFYAWGAQFNLGPVALPYVPTEAAARFGPAIDWLSGISDYGIRSESARTNLALYSADLNNAAWSVSDATKGAAVTAPDGTLTARSIAFGASTTAQLLQSLVAGSAGYSFSVYARSTTAKKFRLKFFTGVANVISADFTTSTTWTRFTFTATNAVADIGLFNESAGGVGTVEFWCPQLEAGTEASSPILTYAATATRAADLLLVPDTSAGLVGQSQGTIAVSAVARVVGNLGVVSINDGSASDRVDIRSDGTTTVTLASSALSSPTVATMVAGALAKTSMSYSLRAAAASRAGSLPVPVGDAPAFTQLQLGGIDGGTTANLDGWITSVQIAQTSSLPASLQGMTA